MPITPIAPSIDPLQPSLLKLQTDSEEVAAEMILSLNDLINFNWKQKRQIDEINYLVKHVDLSITMEGLQTAPVTLVTT